jgi:hypothetical protein
MFFKECELDIEAMSDGDARRCPRHPEVVTSSPDGLFDTPCGACELEQEAAAYQVPDEAIDTSDIPLLGDDFFSSARLTRPGESLLDDEEAHDRPANDWKPRP